MAAVFSHFYLLDDMGMMVLFNQSKFLSEKIEAILKDSNGRQKEQAATDHVENEGG